MRLYVGGFGQSKANYVARVEGVTEFFDGEKDDISEINNYRAINKLNYLIKRLLDENRDIWAFLDTLEAEVIICDEVGNGIVPMNRDDEIYRNTVGRCCCILAERSDRVIRIICGIGQVIK